jgi:hypothetical protein
LRFAQWTLGIGNWYGSSRFRTVPKRKVCGGEVRERHMARDQAHDIKCPVMNDFSYRRHINLCIRTVMCSHTASSSGARERKRRIQQLKIKSNMKAIRCPSNRGYKRAMSHTLASLPLPLFVSRRSLPSHQRQVNSNIGNKTQKQKDHLSQLRGFPTSSNNRICDAAILSENQPYTS